MENNTQPKSGRNFRILSALVLLAVCAGAFAMLNRREDGAQIQSTDDAYVRADLVQIAAQVAGTVMQLNVSENQQVTRGTPLLSIDDRAPRLAQEAARADQAAAAATVAGLQAQIARQGSSEKEARAALDADQAAITLASASQTRYAHLAADGSGSQEAQQQADAQLRTARASLARDQARLSAVGQQTKVLEADLARAQAAQARARASEDEAALRLSFTQVAAPVDGVVTRRSAQVGDYVAPGTPLLVLVPLQAVYVEANFRETQLVNVKPGQAVSVHVDALPGVTLHGQVESLAAASGASLSPVAAHNATGNFTKIVQRLPVRIALSSGQAELARLRVGMSVTAAIDTQVSK